MSKTTAKTTKAVTKRTAKSTAVAKKAPARKAGKAAAAKRASAVKTEPVKVSRTGLKRLTFFVSQSSVDQIRKHAKKNGQSYQTLMRQAVDKYAASLDRKAA